MKKGRGVEWYRRVVFGLEWMPVSSLWYCGNYFDYAGGGGGVDTVADADGADDGVADLAEMGEK